MTKHVFTKEYLERTCRNIGIMDHDGLARVRETKIAVGGLGLGGSIFINLVRLGFEKFHVADPDVYERSNGNRQRLAKESTVQTRKDDALIAEAKDINPDIEITPFRDGVKPENVDAFLQGVEFAVDVVDLFAMTDKLALNEAAFSRGIPVASCAAVGFSGAMVVFENASGPSFRELSGISEENDHRTNVARFVDFIMPGVPLYMKEQLHAAMSGNGHIPFVVPGVEISAALAAAEIAKHVLEIGNRVTAPRGIFMDPFEHKVDIFTADWRARDRSRELSEDTEQAA